MKKIALTLVAPWIVLGTACAPTDGNAPPTVRGLIANAVHTTNSATPPESTAFRAGNTVSPAPEVILVQTVRAFGSLKNFRVRETMDPVAGTHATYEIQVLVPDKERMISRGDCPNNVEGETIIIGKTRYQRCGQSRWTKTQLSGKGSFKTYKDYFQNSYPFALQSLEAADDWELFADYVGADAPPGTMTWTIGKSDYLPRKLAFITGGYALVSDFRDFDNSSIVIRPP